MRVEPPPKVRHLALVVWLVAMPLAAAAQTVNPAQAVQRGYQLLLQRQDSGCVLCHRIPGLPVGGDIGPSLHGLAERAQAPAVRERVADPRRFNPSTIMPAYFSLAGLTNVARAYQGQTVLNEQALDDILAYLMQPEGSR